jgi:hypothetical protein
MEVSTVIRGVKQKKQWAVFAPNGDLQYRTISDTRKDAMERVIGYHELGARTWHDYAVAGYTTNKILVDIKLL